MRGQLGNLSLGVTSLFLAMVGTILSGSVHAGHPDPVQMAQVKQMAHQLETDAALAHQEAERYAHHGDYAEQWALTDLHRLAESARHFHQQVESYFQNPQHTESDFIQLNRDFENAQRSFRYLHAYSYVQYLFDRMVQTVYQLRWFYEQSGGDSWNGEQIKRLAHQLEDAARYASQAAAKEATWDYWKRQAVIDLQQLERAADHFHAQVEQYWQDPQHTRSDFDHVQSAYYYAERSVSHAHFSFHVINDFERARQVLSELGSAYGSGGHGGYPGHP